VGKTALAVDLCLRAGGEIVSIDSRQVYRGIEVASNAPGAAELRGVACHLVSVADPHHRMDAAAFLALARPVIEDLERRGVPSALTAGTGLCLKALLEGLDLGGHPGDLELRHDLQARVATDLAGLYRELQILDPGAAVHTEPSNPVRVIRSYELAVARQRRRVPSTIARPPLAATKIGLTAPRDVLYTWIEKRVDRMIAGGLPAEVERLLSAGVDPRSQAFRGIGVGEMARHLAGEVSLDEARATIIRNTRRYAKRQLTWFRADLGVRWFDVSEVPRSDIVDAMLEVEFA
jgi:tRNA dimethylallyltransferase